VYGTGRSVVDIFKRSQEVTIFGDGMQTRDYVYIDDIVNGLLLAKDWPLGEYEMGSGKQTTVMELAAGKSVLFAPARKEARESIMSNTTPNWYPQMDVLEYLYEN
jgi:nucleoside-diphosphate-sugar epimerase